MEFIKYLHNPQPHIQQVLFQRDGAYYVASLNEKKDEIEVFRSNPTGAISDWSGLTGYVDWININEIERLF